MLSIGVGEETSLEAQARLLGMFIASIVSPIKGSDGKFGAGGGGSGKDGKQPGLGGDAYVEVYMSNR